jgi:hypothetical protein
MFFGIGYGIILNTVPSFITDISHEKPDVASV